MNTPNTEQKSIECRPDDYNGLCPECHQAPIFVHVERHHFCVCHRCKTCWSYGENLMSCWRDLSPEDWEKAARLIASCERVEPVYWPPSFRGRLTRWCNRARYRLAQAVARLAGKLSPYGVVPTDSEIPF